MVVKESGSWVSMMVISVLAAAFVGFISWGTFNDAIRICLAAGITFVIVFSTLLLLRLIQKDDDVTPGVPRLK